jgi:hypothetical protein
MRGFRRWIFNGLAVVSLVLCIATAILWGSSYKLQPELSRCGWNKRAVAVYSGCVQFYSLSRFEMKIMGRSLGLGKQMAYTTQQMPHAKERPGWRFSWRERFWPPGDNRTVFIARSLGGLHGSGDPPRPGLIAGGGFEMSLWSILILTSVLPTMWLIRFSRATRRMASGRCQRCGYNLTGNVSGVCPECGTAIARKSE